MGWGLAVVYVGQQTWGRTPRTLTPQRLAQMQKSGKTCNADLIYGRARPRRRGRRDRRDAEGGIPRALDRLPRHRADGEDAAGDARLLSRLGEAAARATGATAPACTCTSTTPRRSTTTCKAEFAAAGVDEEPRIWVASGRGFEEGKAPQDVGFAFAGVWQGMIDVARTVADIKLPLDVNVSTWESPSDPERVGE